MYDKYISNGGSTKHFSPNKTMIAYSDNKFHSLDPNYKEPM